MPSSTFRALGGAALLGLSGCTALADCACRDPSTVGCAAPTQDYLLVEARQGAALDTPPKIEVSETPVYLGTRETSGVAAIRLPETCANDSASQVTGQSRHVDAIVQTACGVWLAELEKALVAAHFRVVSWDSLRGLERSKNIPAYTAARELGADVLFMFNSVEAAPVAPGGKAASQLNYFHSNSIGERGEAFLMTDTQRAPVRAFVEQNMEGIADRELAQTARDTERGRVVIALSSMLDATAVQTSSGESMWFYRNQAIRPVRDRIGRRFLFIKAGDQWHPTRRDLPVGIEMPKMEALSAEDTSHTNVSGSTDPYAEERLELVRWVAQDFVARYRTGSAGGR